MEITCSYTFMDWTGIGNLYTCVASRVKIDEPNIEIKAFNGSHLPGKSPIDVEAISFAHTTVKYFPRGLYLFYPRLIALTVNDCGLQNISKEDLFGLENLRAFYLSFNILQALPTNLLTNMINLRRVSFCHNKLTTLSPKVLDPIAKNDLTYVNFRGNKHIDALLQTDPIEGHTFEDLVKAIDQTCDKPPENDQIMEVSFSDEFQELWNSRETADFAIETRSKKLPVHKCVLSQHSLVFETMFNGKSWQESKTNEMQLKDFSAEGVEDFLRFLYTGKIASEANALELFELSALYDIRLLKTRSEEIILRNIDDSTAFEVFKLAHIYSTEKMKILSFAAIRRMFTWTNLPDNLIDNPQAIQLLMEAGRERVRKIQEAKDECDLKVKEAEKEFNVIMGNI